MAACEKYCEFSNEYPGHSMYLYKRDHIQIMPQFRKEFRGQKATLFIFEAGLKEVWGSGSYSEVDMDCINQNPTEEDWDQWKYYPYVAYDKYGFKHRYGTFFDSIKQYKAFLKKEKSRKRILMQYDYFLFVPGCPGQVNGIYTNNTFNLKAVKRRLGRMVGKKNLTVRKVKGNMYQYIRDTFVPTMVK